MKWIFGFLTLILTAAPANASCWNSSGTCVDAPGTAAGQGCKSPGVTPKACFIKPPSGGCYIIYNSTGKDAFIPTKTLGEFNSFVTNHTGFTESSGTAGVNCWP